MRVSWLWFLPALALGALAGDVASMWLLPRCGTTAIWMVASVLAILILAITILFLMRQ